MKNIIKKYPKRFITIAAVILLAAVCGTLYNYAVYRNSPYAYMHEIYGSEGLSLKSTGAVYYKNHWLQREIWVSRPKQAALTIDSESYEPDGVIHVKLENKDYSNIEFYSGQYLLQVKLDDEWYIIHTGEINKDARGELTQLARGESCEFDIALDSIREVGEEEIKLRKGKYRLCKKIKIIYESREKHGEAWLGCEFEVI